MQKIQHEAKCGR